MKTTTTALALLATQACLVASFQNGPLSQACPSRTNALLAKKKGRGGSKGFGKLEAPSLEKSAVKNVVTENMSESSPPLASPRMEKGAFLQSVQGGTDATPAMENLPPEERAKQVLREKYGMKTLEEQQATEKQIQSLKAQQRRLAELKRQADAGDDVDIISMIPPPLLKGLDTFLKLGVVVSGTAFILAGFAITAEAWSKASEQPLPENIDTFITNVVEPNFTPGLLVVLAFSVSLGALAAAQLGSQGAQYREK